MKKVFLPFACLLVLLLIGSYSFAQMSTGHGVSLLAGGWGWGMNSGLVVMIIIAILVILTIVYYMTRW